MDSNNPIRNVCRLLVRVSLISVALLGSQASAATWKVRSEWGDTVKLYLRATGSSFGDPILLPPDKVVKIQLKKNDPYFLELEFGEGIRLISDGPLRLKRLAENAPPDYVFLLAYAVVAKKGEGDFRPTRVSIINGGEGSGMRASRPPKALKTLMTSRWNTTYRTRDGGSVDAFVRLNGIKGSYRTTSFTARLENVHYMRDSQKKQLLIQGRWRLGNQSGTFLWSLDESSPSRFDGKWKFDDGETYYQWKGRVQS